MAEELVCHYKASVSPQVPLDVAPHQVTVCIIFDPLQSMDVFELVIFGDCGCMAFVAVDELA